MSAIGDDEVGQGQAFLCQTGVAAAYHLFHGGVVVGSGDGSDVIFPVFLFAGFQLLKDHTGGYGIFALDVGVVEQFDAVGQFFQAQIALDFAHQTHGLLFGIQFLGLFQAVEFVLFYVQPGEVQQLFFLSFLRNGLLGIALRQIYGKRDDDFSREALVSLAHLHDAEGQQFRVVLVQFFLVFEGEGLVDAAVGDVQIVDVGYGLLAFYAEDVYVVQQVGDNLAAGAELFDQFILFFDDLGLFEAQFFGQLHHLFFHTAGHFGGISLQYLAASPDTPHVVLPALFSYAGTGTIVDVVV